MTPQEYALKLCQKFGYLGIKWEQTNFYTLDLSNAKQCAILCVDEMTAMLDAQPLQNATRHYRKEQSAYLQAVRAHLETM